MHALATLLLAQALAQEPSTDAAVQAAQQAAQAAERAAQAAERAANAAEKIAGAAAPARVEAAKEEAKEVTWTSVIGLGLISLTGNSRSVTGSLTASVDRVGQEWTWGAKASAAYGQSYAPGTNEAQVVALNGLAQLRGARRFTPRYSGYLLAEIFTDHVKSVEARPAGEAGAGIIWLADKQGEFLKTLLRTDLGFRYGEEYRFQYYPTPENIPDVTLAAPKVGIAFRYALDENVIFTEDAEVLLNVVGVPRVLVNSTTKVATKLSKSLALNVAFQVNSDSEPAPGKVPTDTALTVGVELGL